jgi:hypothetical protein
LVGGVISLAGFFVFFWMSYWSELLLLSSKAFMILFGIGSVISGFGSSPDFGWSIDLLHFRRIRNKCLVLLFRSGCFLFGAATIALGSWSVIEDFLSPRLVITGKVD